MGENMFKNIDWLHGILEFSSTGLWSIVIDSNTGINSMYASESMLKILGLEGHPSPEECYQHWWSRVGDEYKDYVGDAVSRMLTTGKQKEVQYIWNHPQMGKTFVRCSGKLENCKNGIYEIRGYHQNITEIDFLKADNEMSIDEKKNAAKIESLELETKHLEEQMRDFRSFLRNFLRNTNSFEIFYYPKERKLVIPKEISEKYNVETEYKNMPYSFSEENIVAEFKDSYEDMYERIHAGADTASCEYAIWEEKIWFRTDLSVIRRDEEGNTLVVGGVVEDISDNRQQQRENELLQRIANFTINNDYESLTIVDLEKMQYSVRDAKNWKDAQFPDGKIIPIERQRGQLEKFAVEEDMNEMGLGHIISELNKAKHGAYAFTYTAVNGEHKMARCGWFEKDKRLLISVRNIEALWQQELENKRQVVEALKKAEAANQAKSDFLSRMSHDIRTPLNAIVGMVAIAHKYQHNSERVMECLDTILNSSNYLSMLINNVLDMAKIESEKLELSEESFDLEELLSKMVDIIVPSVDAKQHSLNVTNQGITHKYVIGDKVRLQQLLLNVLNNAVKYTNPGGRIELVIKEPDCEKEGYGLYQFDIKDNGIGIEEKFLPNLFTPFERQDAERVGNIEGTGLGMSIAKKMANMMDGDITVESKVNVGSKFTITVYLKLDDKMQDEIEKQDDAVWDKNRIPNLTGKNILLVEDNAINREIVQEILSDTGAHIEVAVNGKIAVEKVQQAEENEYHIILMDVRMPIMNGYEAAKRIRELERHDAKNVPIIAMTADAFAEDVRKAKECGMNDHIAKPIDIGKLYEALRKWA